MGRRVDLDSDEDRDAVVKWLQRNLLDARKVADMIGLTHRNGVYTYRSRHEDFPQPVITHGRCYMWHRGDIRRWMRTRGKR